MQRTSPADARVAVAIVIDQLPSWMAEERLAHLPHGGFSRLRREGTWVKQLSYLHAVTETAPGHASLFTGKAPHETRIVGNQAWRTDLGRVSSLLEDPRVRTVGPGGVQAQSTSGVSLAYLAVPTLADRLKHQDPGAVVVSLSLKDRGAAFAGGSSPNASVWYDEQAGTWVSSTAFIRNEPATLPAFVLPYARVVDGKAPLPWPLFDPAFMQAHAETPDDQPGEGETFPGRTFPHQVPAEAARSGFPLTPGADAQLVELAIASLSLHDPNHPFLLAVSLSTHDYVGHAFGPHSWESWNSLWNVDAQLGRLWAALDAKFGKDGYSVVLSSDHGIPPLPELTTTKSLAHCKRPGPDPHERPCGKGGRIQRAALQAKLEAALRGIGAGPFIERIVDSRLILSDVARALPEKARQRLDAALRRAVRAQPGVAQVFSKQDFGSGCPAPDLAALERETVHALVCRSLAKDLAKAQDGEVLNIPGDYYLVLEPGYFFGGLAGVNHGAPYAYDRNVPLLVRYPGGTGEQVVERAGFGSFYASLWYALTGEDEPTAYGGVVGAP